MKKEKEKKEVVLADSVVRLLEFVESHGGPTQVARRMGTSPQIFYNYRNGLSKPGTDVYMDIKKCYPEFDANYILFGQDSGNAFHPEPNPEMERELQHLKEKVAYLQLLAEAKGVVFPKSEGVTFSPKLYDVEGYSGVMKSESLPLGWLPIHVN